MHNTELSLVCRVLGQSSRQFDAIRPTLISSNKHSLSSKAAPCQPPWYWVQHVPSSWGCPLEPPPQPTSQQLRSAHYTWSSQTESLQPLLLKDRKFVWYFRLIHWNKDHNNVKSISYLSKVSWSQAAVQLYLEVPSWSACYSEHTFCQGNSHSQQKC